MQHEILCIGISIYIYIYIYIDILFYSILFYSILFYYIIYIYIYIYILSASLDWMSHIRMYKNVWCRSLGYVRIHDVCVCVYAQGRILRPQPEGRHMVGNFKDSVLLDMSFGPAESLDQVMPNEQVTAANFGADRRSVRRARGAVLNAALCVQEAGLKRAFQPGGGAAPLCRVLKLGWDETTMRLYCSLAEARKLFPALQYTEADDLAEADDEDVVAGHGPTPRTRKLRSEPSFRLQIMQQAVYAGVDKLAPLQTLPTVIKSTSASDIWSGASCWSYLDRLHEGLGPSDFILVCANADSLEANKNVVCKAAMEHPGTLIVDGPCMGCS